MRRSSFNFEENHLFVEEGNPQTKLIQLRKNKMELIQMVLETYLPKIIFIDEECGNLKVVFEGGQFTRNNNSKRKSEVYKPIDVHSVTNGLDKIEVSMVFLVVTFFVGRQ